MDDQMHNWTVYQTKNGQTHELGGVRALTRKGACYEAYQAFRIAHHERSNISVRAADDDAVTFSTPDRELVSE